MRKHGIALLGAAAALTAGAALPATAVASPSAPAQPAASAQAQENQADAGSAKKAWKVYDKYSTHEECKRHGRALVKAPNKIDKYKCTYTDSYVLWIRYDK